jgi:hypothetical protein
MIQRRTKKFISKINRSKHLRSSSSYKSKTKKRIQRGGRVSISKSPHSVKGVASIGSTSNFRPNKFIPPQTEPTIMGKQKTPNVVNEINAKLKQHLTTKFSGKATGNEIANFLKAKQHTLTNKTQEQVAELFKTYADIGNNAGAVSPTKINPLQVELAEQIVRHRTENTLKLLESARQKKLLTPEILQKIETFSPQQKLAYLQALQSEGENIFGFNNDFFNTTPKQTIEPTINFSGNSSQFMQRKLKQAEERAKATSSPVKLPTMLSKQRGFSSNNLKKFEEQKENIKKELKNYEGQKPIDLLDGQALLNKLVELHRPFTTTQISPQDRLLIVPPDVLKKYFTEESLRESATKIIDGTMLATKNNNVDMQKQKRLGIANDIDRLRATFNLPELPDGTSYADRKALERTPNDNVAALSKLVSTRTSSRRKNINSQIREAKINKVKNILGSKYSNSVLQNPYVSSYLDGSISNGILTQLFSQNTAPTRPSRPRPTRKN